MEEKLKHTESSDEASTTTASSEHVAAMDAKCKALQMSCSAKDEIIAGLRKQLEDLQLQKAAEVPKPNLAVEPAVKEADESEAADLEPAPAVAAAPVTTAASRQRLREGSVSAKQMDRCLCQSRSIRRGSLEAKQGRISCRSTWAAPSTKTPSSERFLWKAEKARS